MYLAQYDTDRGRWLQVAARVSHPRMAIDRWRNRYCRLLQTLDAIPGAAASLRVTLKEQLAVALFVTAPATHLAALRSVLGSFTQLDVITDGSIDYCDRRELHDELLRFPRYRCRAVLPHLKRDAAWFAVDFRLSDVLNDLLCQALALGHVISYHMNVEPFEAQPEWQREAAKNALRVAALAGVPENLSQLQSELADRLGTATYITEELIGVDTDAARTWLRTRLSRHLRERYGQQIHAEFQFTDEEHEGSLIATRHRVFFEPRLPLDEVCAQVVPSEKRVELLSWWPAAGLPWHSAQAESAEEPNAASIEDGWAGMPTPYAGSGAYAFISYKRDEVRNITPIVSACVARGHRIWFDNGIPGGAEWDAVIEERVRSCEVLLLFLSRKAVLSKHVRREVKFADALNKPIISIQLEHDVELSHGLGLLLNQYQRIAASNTQLFDEIDRAIQSVRQ